MANRRHNVIVRPAGFSSDEDANSDEEGFSFAEPIKYNKPKIELPKPIEIIETSPLSDADCIRLEASAGDVEKLQSIFEKSNLPIDVISQGCTPLMSAASNCEYNAMNFLLRKGANCNFNQRGYTVLMNACDSLKKSQEEQLRCIQLLIEKGANVNCRQSNGVMPLMLACKRGREKIVAELINAEANMNDQDCMGWTPLIWCIHNVTPGQMKTLEVLLDAGVDTSITCGKGQTAHAHALELGFLHVAAEIPVGGIDRVPFLTDVPTKTDSWEDLRQNLENTDKKQWNLWQDVARSLHELGLLQRYGSKFREREINLVKFLTLTESELESMSMIPLHRKRLLNMTRKLHLKRWTEKSLNVKTLKTIRDTYNMVDEVKLIANIARQITVIHASIAYVRLNMESTHNYIDEKKKLTGEDLNQNIKTALAKAKLLRHELRSYLNSMRSHMSNHKQCPSDWIQPVVERNRSYKALLAVGMAMSVLAVFAWKTCR